MKISFLKTSLLVFVLCGTALPSARATDKDKADPEPKPVTVGKGSYAEFPPPSTNFENRNGKNTDTDRVRTVLEAKLYIDDRQKDKPIPTNRWWTDLILSRYSGNLWSYPLMLKANENGLSIFYPTDWNRDGSSMEPGQSIDIRGEVRASSHNRERIVIADFEGDQYGEGWETEDTAFGDGPAHGPLEGQTPLGGFVGNGFANSFHGGDKAVGTLTSPPFKIERHFIQFLIAGGNLPDKTYVELIDATTTEQLRISTGLNSEQLTLKTWNVDDLKDHMVRIRLVDDATGGWGHIMADQFVQTDTETAQAAVAADQFQPTCAEALRWGDWTVTMRMPQDETHYLDATFGRGMPYVWVEMAGICPHILTPANADWLDKDGKELTFPAETDRWMIRADGRVWAVFAPKSVTLSKGGFGVTIGDVEHPVPYLIVAGLPHINDMELFGKYAFAVPRDSSYDWTYDPQKGEVQTTWTLKTEALQGSERNTLQGWIPHHYRATRNNLSFAGPEFATPRGKLKCAVGTSFQIAWPFNGMAPMLPAPRDNTSASTQHGFSKERMDSYLKSYVQDRVERQLRPDEKHYGGDTYWGGKDLLQYGLYAQMAHELGDKDAAGKLQNALKDALTDWFTYTPGESKHFFARYDRWKALVGFDPSYGSESFTDNHFHYGYFTLSTALLGMLDPEFLKDYGPMARLVAKQYANWDRNDKNFPYLRTFDPWGGHSYAGGYSSAIGNNQESSSEAMQSWGGLFLLGAALDDREMIAAGAMGWAVERSAVEEYWNNYYGWKKDENGSNFPPSYSHTIGGIVGDQGLAFGTFFSGEPMHIYGIQWLPLSPALYYLGRDREFARHQFDQMMEEQAKKKPGFTFSDLKADWGDVTLGYMQFSDPDWAAAKMDELWDANDEIAHSKNIAGLTYYMIHADSQLGPVDWSMHTDVPASLVYHKAGATNVTVVAYQGCSQTVTCHVYAGNRVVGEFPLPSQQLTTQEVALPQK